MSTYCTTFPHSIVQATELRQIARQGDPPSGDEKYRIQHRKLIRQRSQCSSQSIRRRQSRPAQDKPLCCLNINVWHMDIDVLKTIGQYR
jgi:hypothetical protein